MTTATPPTDAEFDKAFETWLAGCKRIVHDYYQANYPDQEPRLHVESGPKYIRIVSQRDIPGHRPSRTVYCFVAKKGGTTKAMGTVRVGDVLKSASWKVPAKHARGNIFDENGGLKYMNNYGAAYLR